MAQSFFLFTAHGKPAVKLFSEDEEYAQGATLSVKRVRPLSLKPLSAPFVTECLLSEERNRENNTSKMAKVVQMEGNSCGPPLPSACQSW